MGDGDGDGDGGEVGRKRGGWWMRLQRKKNGDGNVR